MNFKNKVTMSIDDWRRYENDEDFEFAYGTVDFLSTKRNSHNHTYSEDVIRQYADTVINKWVIAEYDDIMGDVTTHTANQKIVGRVPEQKVKFRYDDDGDLIASVDVVLSKLYANDVYTLFRENNFRTVSIEELVGFTPETESFEDGGDLPKIVEGFNITGITILGLQYQPSVPNASIHLTQMGKDTLKKAEMEYVKYAEMQKDEEYENHPLNKSKEAIDYGEWDGDKAKQDLVKEKKYKTIAKSVCLKLEDGWEDRQVTKLGYPVMNLKNGEWVYNRKGLTSALSYAKQENETVIVSKIKQIYRKLGLDQEEKMDNILEKLENIENKLNKEETMADEKNKVVGVAEDETQKPDTTKDDKTVEENPDKAPEEKDEKPVENADDNADTKDKAEDEKDTADDTKEEQTGDSETDDKDDDTEEKMDCLQKELNAAKQEIEQYKEQIAELKKFKEGVEAAKTKSVVQDTLSKVKGGLSDDKYAEVVESSKDCTYETVTAWKNSVLAQAYEATMSSHNTDDGIIDMGVVDTRKDTVQYDSVFDKM